jgi:hypothetical protein
MSIETARAAQANIQGILGSQATSLVRVPEIENDSTPDAIRKLQIQIFTLTDAVADLVKEIDRLNGR